MTRTGLCATLRHVGILIVLSAIAPAVVAGQWRVSSAPGTGGRPDDVTVEVRERADSVEHLDGPVAFVIRCSAQQLDGFVTTRDKLESDLAADIQVRIESDAVRARNVRWQATKANTGAFVPTRDLIELIQRYVLRSTALRITLPTAQRGRVAYVFPVTDFRIALEALRTACPNDRGGALAHPSN